MTQVKNISLLALCLLFSPIYLLRAEGYSTLCAIGSIYNLPCSALWESYKPSEEAFKKTRNTPSTPGAPYLIEPKTHRMWFTSNIEPQEAPIDRLNFYEKSLQFYKDKPFEHHFWCNNISLIPQTISTIQKFNIPVIIHEISELKEQFFTWELFQKLITNKMFAFASELAKQELLVHEGGLYADIGTEQSKDLEEHFKKYERIHPISRWGFDKHMLGAQKNSSFFTTSLKILVPLMQEVLERRIHIPTHSLHWFLKTDLWRLVIQIEQGSSTPVGYLYQGVDYEWHGLASWHHQTGLLTLRDMAEIEPCSTCVDHHTALTQGLMPKDEKTMYPVQDWMCSISTFYKISCTKLGRYPINNHHHNRVAEVQAFEKAKITISNDAPYLIEPKTHRMWLTSAHSPQEVPLRLLHSYQKSLELYIGKKFSHYFWCMDKNLIPQTIAIIQTFSVPVEIHEMKEIVSRFVHKVAFNNLMNENMFRFASSLARQELLVLEGGLYADMGIEQTKDIEWTFKKYHYVLPIRGSLMDNHFMAAAKGLKFFTKSLHLLHELMHSPVAKKIPKKKLEGFLASTLWQLLAAKEKMPFISEGIYFEGLTYKYQGLGSWYKDPRVLPLEYMLEKNEIRLASITSCLTPKQLNQLVQNLTSVAENYFQNTRAGH